MITRNDCLILLKELEDNGIDTHTYTKKLYTSNNLVDVIAFINDNRQLDLSAFYEKLRKNYNNKKSNLYINIVKSDEEDFNADNILTTLTSLLLQIMLFSKGVENKEMFLRHSRANEISKVLSIYFQNYDLTNCIKLLHLVKADLKVLESVKNAI